jgi:hypothetical protein
MRFGWFDEVILNLFTCPEQSLSCKYQRTPYSEHCSIYSATSWLWGCGARDIPALEVMNEIHAKPAHAVRHPLQGVSSVVGVHLREQSQIEIYRLFAAVSTTRASPSDGITPGGIRSHAEAWPLRSGLRCHSCGSLSTSQRGLEGRKYRVAKRITEGAPLHPNNARSSQQGRTCGRDTSTLRGSV